MSEDFSSYSGVRNSPGLSMPLRRPRRYYLRAGYWTNQYRVANSIPRPNKYSWRHWRDAASTWQIKNSWYSWGTIVISVVTTILLLAWVKIS